MSPQLTTSQGMVLATTAAMAVSGTVILLALRLHHHKTLPSESQVLLRPCISSSDERRRSRVSSKKMKRVRFADDVAYPEGPCSCPNSSSTTTTTTNNKNNSRDDCVVTTSADKVRGMPANRVALYNGILKDRVIQRMAYSY